MFSNDVVGETIYTDKTALEDAIQFQDIDFEQLQMVTISMRDIMTKSNMLLNIYTQSENN